MIRQVILDTETTGLDAGSGDRIIEIGCLEMIDRRLSDRAFHVYINPGRPVDPEAFKVHGISDDFLKDKPVFSDIAEEFLAFIRDSELIIHNASFDVGFIDAEFQYYNPNIGSTASFCRITDTLDIARKKHPGQKNSLDALCKRYQVDNSNRELHGALLDAELLAKVYLLMTGGQRSFLEDTDAQYVSMDNRYEQFENLSHFKTISIQLSDVDESKHQAYLKMLSKNADGVVWQESNLKELTHD